MRRMSDPLTGILAMFGIGGGWAVQEGLRSWCSPRKSEIIQEELVKGLNKTVADISFGLCG